MVVSAQKKHLLVEGHDDLYAIAHLMGKHISWSDKKEDAPVKIVVCGSDEEILESVPIRLKANDFEIMGIVIDADDNSGGRWNRLHSLCKPFFPNIPDALPQDGL